ncbi:hypothetical protein YY63_25385 [Salmonella enterica subsp. enterica]|nr:hypothetical protein [Salmonella enterica subsp. enterica serovar Oranienburg]
MQLPVLTLMPDAQNNKYLPLKAVKDRGVDTISPIKNRLISLALTKGKKIQLCLTLAMETGYQTGGGNR